MSGLLSFTIVVQTHKNDDGSFTSTATEDFTGAEISGPDPHKVAHEMVDLLSKMTFTVVKSDERVSQDNQ